MTEGGRIARGILRKLRGPRKAAMNFSTRHDLDARWQLIAARLLLHLAERRDVGMARGGERHAPFIGRRPSLAAD